MLIGILTQPLLDNYGGTLQNYALQRVLEELGHESRTFDRCYRWNLWHYYPAALRVGLMKILGKWEEIPFPEKPYHGYMRQKHFGRFIERNIHRQDVKGKMTASMLEGFDAVIVGSDQVWRPVFNREDMCTPLGDSFLEFAPYWSGKRIAYAASFGVDENEYTQAQIERYKPLLKKFDNVSVREKSGINIIKEHFDRNDSVVMPDPTLLLTTDAYRELYKTSDRITFPSKFIFAGILDLSKAEEQTIRTTAQKKGLKVIFPSKQKLSPDEWLKAIDQSECIVTDSFHCCVFSIIFGKKLAVKPSIRRGSARFEDLFNSLGLKLSEYLIEDYDELLNGKLTAIPGVTERLVALRVEGRNWLKQNLV